MTTVLPTTVTVLQSFPEPRPTSNPYTSLLRRSVEHQAGLRVLTFTYRHALLGTYDVVHLHWPETLVDGRSPLKKLVRQGLYALFLLRILVTRTPVVRTLHNLGLPTGISRREAVLLRLTGALTSAVVVLNARTPTPAGIPVSLIPHGHYRDWFDLALVPTAVRGRIAYFGLVRGYKGVQALVRAFRETGRERGLTLTVSGRPSSQAIASEVRALAEGDDRIRLELEHLSDGRIVEAAGEAEVVVLPYREMHNSGGVLASLSIGRPVLVPDNDVNRDLRSEVGASWIHLFEGDLTAEDLLDVVDRVREDPPVGRPALAGRDWDRAGTAHARVYRDALLRRGTGRRWWSAGRRTAGGSSVRA